MGVNDEIALERLLLLAFDLGEPTDDDRRQPEIAALLKRRASGAPPDERAASSHMETAATYRASGDYASAFAHFRAAFAHTAPSSLALVSIAALQLQIGAHAAAESLLKTARPNTPPSPDIDLHLAHVLWAQHKCREALAICAEAVVAFPNSAAIIETAVLMEGRQGDPARALEWALAFLRAHASLAGEGLLDHMVHAAIASRRTQILSATLSELDLDLSDGASIALSSLSLASVVGETWQALLRNNPLPDSAATDDIAGRPEALKGLLAAEPPARALLISDASLRGIYGKALKQDPFAAAGLVLPPSKGFADRGFITTNARERSRMMSATRPLHLDVLRNRCVSLPSPFGGFATSTAATVLSYDPGRREFGSVIAYFFEMPKPCFVLFCAEDHFPQAWYDPEQDILLIHDSMEEFAFYLQERVRELKLAWLADPVRTKRYLEGRTDRLPALVVGMLDYISTSLFTDLQGIQHVLEAGLINTLSRMTITGPEPFGPVDALFPELSALPIERPPVRDLVSINHHLWEAGLMAARVPGGFVGNALADRVLKRADRLADVSWRQEIDALSSSHFPLIFVSLRVHGRRWLRGEGEIAEIFNALRLEFPDLAVVLDGHCVTGAPLAESLVAQERGFLEGIMDALEPNIPVMVSAGRSMSDSLFAASRSHVHLSAQGTSTAKSVLVANKPGVVIGSRQFGWDVTAFRDPVATQITPWREAIDASTNDIQCDFDLNPKTVLSGLGQVIRSVRPD